MAYIVMVHGSWHGAWCWQPLAARLTSAGHRPVAMDLPAHGADLADPATVTLAGYTERVVSSVEECPEPVVLLGHSMGGMVISSVAEAMPERISRLVYLAAALPQDGECLLDISMSDPDSAVGPNLVLGGPGTVELLAGAPETCFYADCAPAVIDWAAAQVTPEPVGPLSEPVHLTPARWGRVPRTYIACENDRAITPAVQMRQCYSVGVDELLTIPSGHSPFLSCPDDLAGLLGHITSTTLVAS